MKRKEYKENLTGSLPSAQRGKVKFKVKYKGTHTIQPTTRQTTTTYYYIYYYYILPTTTYYYYTLPYTMSANANASSKRPRQSADKTFDPRDEAKKPAKKTKPAPTVAPKPKATGPVTGPRPTTQAQAQAQAQAHPDPQPEDSSIRTEQELNAEARQTALDIGFVLLLSEDPYKALQEAKNDLEKEEAIRAIKLKEVVSTLKDIGIVRKLSKCKHTYLLQNDKYKQGENSAPEFNNNAYPNLQAHASKNPPPTSTTTQQAMDIQFERLRQQKEQAEARQRKLNELVNEKRAQRQADSKTARTTRDTEVPILSMTRSLAPGHLLSPLHTSGPSSPTQAPRGEKEKTPTHDSDDDWANDLEVLE